MMKHHFIKRPGFKDSHMSGKIISRKLMGKKLGMTQLFDDKGHAIVCTVIQVEPNVVTQIKTKESDGYNAVQIGYDKVVVKDERTMAKRVTMQLVGHYKKAGVEPRRHLTEIRLDTVDAYTLGQEISADIFEVDDYVDAMAISKGKGYQGVMKLHNFAGGPAAHGSSFHRHAGSTGHRSTPGRCFPGGPRASHMGLERKTVQNIKVVKVQDNLLILKGQVPGSRNGLVYISEAQKKTKRKQK
jgi:large subunit ribosomal protein L3